MPHLKVNVNGKRYTISGLTRGTCSKQILCALAKVDAELQASETLKEKRNAKSDSDDLYSSNEGQSDKSWQVRESRRKSKRGETKTCKTCEDGEGKPKHGEKEKKKARSTKKITKLDSKGIQTSNGMLETLGNIDESQQNCSSKQHEEDDLKEKVLENSLHTVKDMAREVTESDAVMAGKVDNKKTNVEEQARETDHDTGISELHSDSSFETNQLLHNSEKENVTGIPVKKNLNQASPVEVKCASTNTDPMETADVSHMRMRENEEVNFSEDQFIVAQLLGSETDVDNDDECTCNCVYVDSGSEELQPEIKKVQGDLQLTEVKLVEQNKMMESLNALIHADQPKGKNDDVSDDVSDDVTKRIDELKRSIKLINQLYDYQTLETRANALELDRVESQLRRKQWHVESLRKELRSARNNPSIGGGQRSTIDYLREGTLV